MPRILEKTPTFTKDLQKLSADIQQEAWQIACILKENIFDNRLRIRKLEGYKKLWRVVVKKDYRMIYTFDKDTVCLLRIQHRKDIYRIDFL